CLPRIAWHQLAARLAASWPRCNRVQPFFVEKISSSSGKQNSRL
ncbi:hypothetical protein, partial [Pseudomonas sp. FG-3G]